MNSDMESSNVWGESPLSTEANSASVLYTAASGADTAYPNPYNAFSADDTMDTKVSEDDVDNIGHAKENRDNHAKNEHTTDHPWDADPQDAQPYKSYSPIYDNVSHIDEFKIQNELAQTMKSILLNEERNAGVEGDSDNDNEQTEDSHFDQTDHVHYVDNIHRKSDMGNPFLASSIKNNDGDAVGHIDINLLKEKKNELLSSLTKDTNTRGFLEDNEDDKINTDELFALSPAKTAMGLSNGVDDSPLNNLLSLAGSNAAGAAEANDSNSSTAAASDRLSKSKGFVSPNRKIKILRPRRIAKSVLRSEPSTSVKDLSSATDSSNLTPVDPLSAPLQNDTPNGNNFDIVSVSPRSRKQKFITESEAPLFNVNRDQVLENSRHPISPVSSVSVSESFSPSKYHLEDEKGEKFDITVGDPIKVGEITDTHVVYTINTKTKSDLFDNQDTTVTRRYRDFLWLYHQLLNNHPGYVIPPPPEKQVYGRFNDKFIENRRLALENMLNKVSQRKVLQTDPDFIIFLRSENFTEDSKERETIVRHDPDLKIPASVDENTHLDGPMNTMAQILNATASLGISESSSGGGFFSSLIGLNAPKYVEEDPFILEKQAYIDSLDTQLRQLTQSLDMILEKRDELTLSLQDVTTVIQQLVDLEVNVEITDILSNFEELQSKVKEILERGNLSQVLTFGSTVDEYVRLIGSIRNCFENRLKICNSVATLKQHQEKKEHSLARFRAKNQNQPEKIKRYEDELSKINSVLDKQVLFKDEFDKIFKSELSRFEFGKIKDFKNMVEIYWESLIENQKILIELWESFYDKCVFDS
ncbi:hypothetical protein PICMEDRAFT_14311 [Pichia membranifaciens NRRL Y-2026]|uniref:PX domain-containing protein n=1 Tax=Pichia membranifaciens NRRL Y-2026 TaxID=763406 RepID=A0A1E3NT86_9ASCO|nr:hypothetical protein PICMEDRAFT_14311 [Pichia membranifaciens NRRL Y-2026]ODQ48773.1 hypothetical protein PICMEDRAFT_14311 [Pichia membranifaciens NRRL Y-2026]